MDKPTNYKRKTPCATTKKSLLDPGVTEVWCRCCGEWKMRFGKPVRVIGSGV